MDEMTRESITKELVQLQEELEETTETLAMIKEERNILLRRLFEDSPETFVAGGYRFTKSVRVAYDLDKYTEVDPITADSIKTTRKLLKNLESVWKDRAKDEGVGVSSSEVYSATRVA